MEADKCVRCGTDLTMGNPIMSISESIAGGYTLGGLRAWHCESCAVIIETKEKNESNSSARTAQG